MKVRERTSTGPADHDEALSRAAEILRLWREGRTYSEVAAELDVPVRAVSTMVQLLVAPEDREAQRAALISRAQQRFSDEDLIELLRACAGEIGKTPGASRFDRWLGSFSAQLLLMRFGSWATGCERAGLAPNARPNEGMGQRKYSDEDHRRAYARIKALLDGKSVTVAAWNELALPSEPREGILRRRYGGWRAFKAAMEANTGAPGQFDHSSGEV